MVLVLATWVVMLVSTIALVEAAWWKWEDAAPTPLDEMTVDSGMAVEAARGGESPMIATP